MAHKEYELTDLIRLMEEKKVLRVKLGSMEVELSPDAFAAKKAEEEGPGAPEKVPTEDEFMRWSVDGAFVEAPEEKN